jgi:SAM-dependent methyltransferase
MSRVRDSLVAQFGNPRGIVGRLAGLIMVVRPSNRERNRRTLELLELGANDRVLELGFGPGLSVQAASAQAGTVVGVDHSPLMVREATRRNARAIAAGRVELHLGTAESLPPLGGSFDKVLAVNVYMFWREPVAVLRQVRGLMRPGGTIALTLQPRQRGATRDDTLAAAQRMTASLVEAGFTAVRTEILEMDPVAAACVLGRAP